MQAVSPQNPNEKDSSSIRVNKALATAGVCSRRQADSLVSAGRVTVNGQIVTELGHKITPGRDTLAVDGKMVSLVASDTPLTLLLHKLAGVVTTAHDPEGRPTVFDNLPEPFRSRRLFSVGRLDYFSEGLLLLTTDGELAFRLTHPRWHIPKRYRVTVRGPLTATMLNTMEHGMTLAEGERLAPIRARVADRVAADCFALEMELSQGINRQIRRMCRDLGLTVLKLARIAQGPLELGDLPPGKCRKLTEAELAALQRAVGMTPPPSGERSPHPSRQDANGRPDASQQQGRRPPKPTRS